MLLNATFSVIFKHCAFMVIVLILCFLNTASLIGSISIEPHSLYQKRKARNFDNYKKAANGLLQFCIQLQLTVMPMHVQQFKKFPPTLKQC